MDRTISHHETATWLETAGSLRDDWIAGRLTNEAASAFIDWAIKEISGAGHVAGIDPESGDAIDAASCEASEAYEAAWAMISQMELAMRTLAAMPLFGSDDQRTVRQMLVDTERNAVSSDASERASARLLRGRLGVPMSYELLDGPS